MKRIKIVCVKCKSDDAGRDASAYWDIEKQDWTLGSIYDDPWCNDCGETELEEIELVDEPQDSPIPVAKDYYLLAMLGDVDPYLIGPFGSEDTRTAAAKTHRENSGDEDGLYRLTVDKGNAIDVNTFAGIELDGEAV